jgi:hypothetical protein
LVLAVVVVDVVQAFFWARWFSAERLFRSTSWDAGTSSVETRASPRKSVFCFFSTAKKIFQTFQTIILLFLVWKKRKLWFDKYNESKLTRLQEVFFYQDNRFLLLLLLFCCFGVRFVNVSDSLSA